MFPLFDGAAARRVFDAGWRRGWSVVLKTFTLLHLRFPPTVWLRVGRVKESHLEVDFASVGVVLLNSDPVYCRSKSVFNRSAFLQMLCSVPSNSPVSSTSVISTSPAPTRSSSRGSLEKHDTFRVRASFEVDVETGICKSTSLSMRTTPL